MREATGYAGNFFFRGKFVLLALAGLNMIVFHAFAGRNMERWSADLPAAARIAGVLSLTIWVATVAFGRWIGFTLH